MSQPPFNQGSIQSTSAFTSFGNTFHDILVFTTETDVTTGFLKPKLVFQPKGTQTLVKTAYVPNWNSCYVVPEGNNWKVIVFTNVATLAIAYLDDSYKNLLKSQGTHTFESSNVVFSNGTWQTVIVNRGLTFDETQHNFAYITEFNSNYPHTTKFWTDINTQDLAGYVRGINYPGFDIKLYTTTPSWWTDLAKQAITDVLGTISPLPPLQPGSPQITNLPTTSIIYTKSLFEESAEYFTSALTRLQAELAEEIALQSALTNDDQALLISIQNFIDTKTSVITNLLQQILTLKTSLQTTIDSNKLKLANNHNLYSLITSTPATTLSDNILSLRTAVFDSLKLLTVNGRYGPNSDVVYVINKTQL
jgi:hypothetical protein